MSEQASPLSPEQIAFLQLRDGETIATWKARLSAEAPDLLDAARNLVGPEVFDGAQPSHGGAQPATATSPTVDVGAYTQPPQEDMGPPVWIDAHTGRIEVAEDATADELRAFFLSPQGAMFVPPHMDVEATIAMALAQGEADDEETNPYPYGMPPAIGMPPGLPPGMMMGPYQGPQGPVGATDVKETAHWAIVLDREDHKWPKGRFRCANRGRVEAGRSTFDPTRKSKQLMIRGIRLSVRMNGREGNRLQMLLDHLHVALVVQDATKFDQPLHQFAAQLQKPDKSMPLLATFDWFFEDAWIIPPLKTYDLELRWDDEAVRDEFIALWGTRDVMIASLGVLEARELLPG